MHSLCGQTDLHLVMASERFVCFDDPHPSKVTCGKHVCSEVSAKALPNRRQARELSGCRVKALSNGATLSSTSTLLICGGLCKLSLASVPRVKYWNARQR